MRNLLYGIFLLSNLFAYSQESVEFQLPKKHLFQRTFKDFKSIVNVKVDNKSFSLPAVISEIGNNSRDCHFKPFKLKLAKDNSKKIRRRLNIILFKSTEPISEIRFYPICQNGVELEREILSLNIVNRYFSNRAPKSKKVMTHFDDLSLSVIIQTALKDIAKFDNKTYLSKKKRFRENSLSFYHEKMEENIDGLVEFILMNDILGNFAYHIDSLENVPIVYDKEKLHFYLFDYMTNILCPVSDGSCDKDITEKIYRINISTPIFLFTSFKNMTGDYLSVKKMKEFKKAFFLKFGINKENIINEYMNQLLEDENLSSDNSKDNVRVVFNDHPVKKVEINKYDKRVIELLRVFPEFEFSKQGMSTSSEALLNFIEKIVTNKKDMCVGDQKRVLVTSFYLLSKIPHMRENLIKESELSQYKERAASCFKKLNDNLEGELNIYNDIVSRYEEIENML